VSTQIHGWTLATRGVPFGVTAAQLGHADTYDREACALAPSYVADTIRAHFPKLEITGD
jgi:hypothetical protein